MRVVEHLSQAGGEPDRHAPVLLSGAKDLAPRHIPERLHRRRFDGVLVGHPPRVRRPRAFKRSLRPSDPVREREPERLQDVHAVPAVRGGKERGRAEILPPVPVPAAHDALEAPHRVGELVQAREALQHRDFDGSRGAPAEQRRKRGEVGERSRLVRHVVPRHGGGGAPRAAQDAGVPAEGQQRGVRRRHVPVRPVEPEWRDAHPNRGRTLANGQDPVRIQVRDVVVGEDDIGRPRQRLNGRPIATVPDIEAHPPLAAVDREIGGRPRRRALGRLHLDDLGAPSPEQFRGERGRVLAVRKLEYAHCSLRDPPDPCGGRRLWSPVLRDFRPVRMPPASSLSASLRCLYCREQPAPRVPPSGRRHDASAHGCAHPRPCR